MAVWCFTVNFTKELGFCCIKKIFFYTISAVLYTSYFTRFVSKVFLRFLEEHIYVIYKTVIWIKGLIEG